MQQTVYKYEIPAKLTPMGASFDNQFEMELPNGSKVLSLGVQLQRSHTFMIWVQHPAHFDGWAKRQFAFLGTGHVIETDKELIPVGNYISDGLVFHLFELV